MDLAPVTPEPPTPQHRSGRRVFAAGLAVATAAAVAFAVGSSSGGGATVHLSPASSTQDGGPGSARGGRMGGGGVVGTVSDLAGDDFTVTAQGGQAFAVVTTPGKTTFTQEVGGTVGGIAINAVVLAQGTRDSSGDLAATSITVLPASSGSGSGSGAGSGWSPGWGPGGGGSGGGAGGSGLESTSTTVAQHEPPFVVGTVTGNNTTTGTLTVTTHGGPVMITTTSATTVEQIEAATLADVANGDVAFVRGTISGWSGGGPGGGWPEGSSTTTSSTTSTLAATPPTIDATSVFIAPPGTTLPIPPAGPGGPGGRGGHGSSGRWAPPSGRPGTPGAGGTTGASGASRAIGGSGAVGGTPGNPAGQHGQGAFGTVSNLGTAGFTVTSPRGDATIVVSPSTTYTEEAPGTVSQIAMGDNVFARGTRSSSGDLAATQITVGPASTGSTPPATPAGFGGKGPFVIGTVATLGSDGSFTVGTGSAAQRVTTGSGTTVSVITSSSLGEMANGDVAWVAGTAPTAASATATPTIDATNVFFGPAGTMPGLPGGAGPGPRGAGPGPGGWSGGSGSSGPGGFGGSSGGQSSGGPGGFGGSGGFGPGGASGGAGQNNQRNGHSGPPSAQG